MFYPANQNGMPGVNLNTSTDPVTVSTRSDSSFHTTNPLDVPSAFSPPSRSPLISPSLASSSSVSPIRVAVSSTPPLRQWRLTNSGLVEISPNSAMGAFLDKPKTRKSNITGSGKDLKYAVASMQGWRVDMEDAHVVEISMADRDPFKDWSFFAVFDGHAGNVAADQSAENILKTLLDTAEFTQATSLLASNGGVLNDEAIRLLETGMKDGFMRLDEIIRANLALRNSDRSGTTAVCAILTPTHVLIANLGDSRAVLSRSGEPSFGTEDHKPYNDKERERIVGAGGSVMIQRINGSLAVSRALGDFEYKAVPGLCPTKQLVSCEPDIYVLPRYQDKDQFMVIACDGIYDVMENDDLCSFVESRLQVSDQLDDVANQVLDACLNRGSRDNMTLILVCFPNAPQVDAVKQSREQEWFDDIRTKITALIDEETTRDTWTKEDEMSVSWVLRQLSNKEDTDNSPAPHRLRTLADQILTEKGIRHDH